MIGMTPQIVHSSEIVTLLGPAFFETKDLDVARKLGGVLVAADGGAEAALRMGFEPDAVIGDFDSISAAALEVIGPEKLIQVNEQDTTDFDKCLRHIAAPLIIALGFTGQRLDHELAVYNSLVRFGDHLVVVVGEADLCFHLSSPLSLNLPRGTRVSLFPMAEVQVSSRGLKWETDHLTFSPWGRIGTSNQVEGDQVNLDASGPGCLVILPKAFLPYVAAELTRSL